MLAPRRFRSVRERRSSESNPSRRLSSASLKRRLSAASESLFGERAKASPIPHQSNRQLLGSRRCLCAVLAPAVLVPVILPRGRAALSMNDRSPTRFRDFFTGQSREGRLPRLVLRTTEANIVIGDSRAIEVAVGGGLLRGGNPKPATTDDPVSLIWLGGAPRVGKVV
jgi:hypothetical protein